MGYAFKLGVLLEEGRRLVMAECEDLASRLMQIIRACVDKGRHNATAMQALSAFGTLLADGTYLCSSLKIKNNLLFWIIYESLVTHLFFVCL